MPDNTEPQPAYAPRIKDLPTADRPRERLALDGAGKLSNPELLAILLRVGTAGENAVRVAERMLTRLGGLPGLHRASYRDLCQEKGVGPAKARRFGRETLAVISASPRP